MDLLLRFVTWICLNLNWLLAVTGVMHEADDVYSIRSTWSCYWLDKFLTLALNILILSIFYISMDLSTNYFAHFSGCWASFVCSCHSILECCVTFSGVKLSIRSFVLFQRLKVGFNIHILVTSSAYGIRTKNPRTKTPRTKTPWTKTPLAKNPPDKNPPEKIYEHKIYLTLITSYLGLVLYFLISWLMINATVSWPHLWKFFAQNSLRAEGGSKLHSSLLIGWLDYQYGPVWNHPLLPIVVWRQTFCLLIG